MSSAALAIVLSAMTGQAGSAAAADELAELPLRVGTSILFDERDNDGFGAELGSWSLTRGSVAGGRLQLHIALEPPDPGLPVDGGPAVLFAGMHVFGGAGDMGDAEPIDALGTVVLPACEAGACRFEALVELPTTEVRDAVDRLEQRAEVHWLEIGLTLVRTFGGGQWLQVIPFSIDDLNNVDGDAGSLGAVKSTQGTLYPYGLFPAEGATPIPRRGGYMFTTGFDYASVVERLRRDAGDASRPLRLVEVHADVRLTDTCDAGLVTMHDDFGDWVFTANMWQRPAVEADVRIPVGMPWRLTLHNGGIDLLDWGVHAGHIESAGAPLAVSATFDCATQTGVVEVSGGVPGPVEAGPSGPPVAIPGEPIPDATTRPAAITTPLPTATTDGGAPGAVETVADPTPVDVTRTAVIGAVILLAGALLLGIGRPRRR